VYATLSSVQHQPSWHKARQAVVGPGSSDAPAPNAVPDTPSGVYVGTGQRHSTVQTSHQATVDSVYCHGVGGGKKSMHTCGYQNLTLEQVGQTIRHHLGRKDISYHFCLACPKYLAAIELGKITLKNPCNFQDLCKKPNGHQMHGKSGNPNPPPHNFKDPKAKAFLAAFNASFKALLAGEDSDGNDEKEGDQEDICNTNYHEDNNLHGCLSMVGPLKE
jgi:hypothetical protein